MSPKIAQTHVRRRPFGQGNEPGKCHGSTFDHHVSALPSDYVESNCSFICSYQGVCRLWAYGTRTGFTNVAVNGFDQSPWYSCTASLNTVSDHSPKVLECCGVFIAPVPIAVNRTGQRALESATMTAVTLHLCAVSPTHQLRSFLRQTRYELEGACRARLEVTKVTKFSQRGDGKQGFVVFNIQEEATNRRKATA